MEQHEENCRRCRTCASGKQGRKWSRKSYWREGDRLRQSTCIQTQHLLSSHPPLYINTATILCRTFSSIRASLLYALGTNLR